jgi:hypothetical protein
MLYLQSLRVLISHINKTFPFTTVRERARWRDRAQVALRAVSYLKSDREFFYLLERLLAHLHDAHTRLGQYPTKVWYGPAVYSVRLVDMRYVLYHRRIAVGTIITIDGKNPAVLMRYHFRRISGSTPRYRRQQALKFVLLDHINHPALVLVRVGTKVRSITIPRVSTSRVRPIDQWCVLSTPKNGVGYLKINSWPTAVTDTLTVLDRIVRVIDRRKFSKLIIDVRGNGGGDANTAAYLLGHLFKQEVPAGLVATRISSSSLRCRTKKLFIAVRYPYLSLPITVLTNAGCISATEYFVAVLKDHHRATTIGEATGGASGNPHKFLIPFGSSSFELLVSTWRYTRPNTKLLERRGIRPDAVVAVAHVDRDEVLEMALKR